MDTLPLRRLMGVLALALLIDACAGPQQAPIATPTEPPAPPPATTAAAPSATPQLAATRAPTIVAPTPTTASTPTTARSPTAIPAATITPTRPRATAPATTPADFHYVFPVRSAGEITYGRFHHDYPAADIFCPVSSEFVAVTGGVVDYVSREDVWDPKVNDGATRGGLSVAIVGDDGVRYYGSHLSEVADGVEPGARVQAGQLLGRTGQSGDARGVAPHLHFGISRPTTPDDWAVRRGQVAPYDYLRAWQRGEDVTPRLP